jgi:hypothetical protein
MTNQTITPGSAAAALTGQAAKLQILGDLKLDPAGPFYQFVLAYLAASAGLTAVYDAAHYTDFLKGTVGIFPSPLAGVGAIVRLEPVVGLARDGITLPQPEAESRLACMLVNTAYESLTVAQQTGLKAHKEGESFRHSRHAASHGNKWHFLGNEPVRPAEWKGVVLGRANFQDKPFIHGTLTPGDLLFLLGDIEKLL